MKLKFVSLFIFLTIIIVACVTVRADADGASSNAGFYFMQNDKKTDVQNGNGYFLLSKTEFVNELNGNVYIYGGSAVFHGNINGNVYVCYGTAVFGKNAKVSGNIVSLSSKVTLQENSVLNVKALMGNADIFFTKTDKDGQIIFSNKQPYFFVITVAGLVQTLIGFALLVLHKRKFLQGAMVISKTPKKVLAYGSILLFMIVAIVIIFVFSIIGFPIAILFGVVYIILVTVGQVSVSIFVGILMKQQNLLLAFLIGSFVIGIIKIIPYAFWIVNFIALPILCFGALAVTFVNRYYLMVHYKPAIGVDGEKTKKNVRDIIVKDLKKGDTNV